jgi:hypothetical protein
MHVHKIATALNQPGRSIGTQHCMVLKLGALQKIDQKYLESSEMWCWRRIETICQTNHVRNEEVLHKVKEKRNILHTTKRVKADWIGHILCRNCLLKHVIEERQQGIVVMGGE